MMKPKSTQPDKRAVMRHSMAHILAAAVQRLWPEARFGVGPVVEDGFYYDIDIPGVAISEDDFSKIEDTMRAVIKERQVFERSEVPIEQAITWAKENKQPYKEELLNDLKRAGTTLVKELDVKELGLASEGKAVDMVTFYTNGSFKDLCRGPHITDTGEAGAFKLTKVAGAYWRGKTDNPQMQRLYGIAFDTKEELKQHLEMLEEAKRRDHRKLGRELDLYVLSDLVGPGLPLFTPRGKVVRDELARFSEELQHQKGYESVWTPHMTRTELYKVSGHFDKYPERFDISSVESDDEFMMKPMNCPHHTQIYAANPKSYRDLPVRYMETTTTYRDEKSGELHGLSRVRAITMDDGHVFCTEDHIMQEMTAIMEMIRDLYDVLGMGFYARLSFSDESDKYLGDPKLWQFAEKTLETVAKELGLEYTVGIGEAAFYGPKIDIMVRDGLGREWQCATEQLDFVQPERFQLEYIAEDGSKKRPVMIHKALLGSIERFMSVYIEHTAGRFPVWLAPEQIRVATVNQTDAVTGLAADLAEQGRSLGLRIHVDNSNESIGKKIRLAELAKVPYVVVLGEKECQSKEVSPRVRKDMAVIDQPTVQPIENFLHSVANEAKSRTSKSSM